MVGSIVVPNLHLMATVVESEEAESETTASSQNHPITKLKPSYPVSSSTSSSATVRSIATLLGLVVTPYLALTH